MCSMLVLCGVIFWLQHQALRRCRMYLDLDHISILPHICNPDYLPSFSPIICFACARQQVSWTTCRLRSMRSCHVQREALTGAYSNVSHACRHVIWKQIREDTHGRLEDLNLAPQWHKSQPLRPMESYLLCTSHTCRLSHADSCPEFMGVSSICRLQGFNMPSHMATATSLQLSQSSSSMTQWPGNRFANMEHRTSLRRFLEDLQPCFIHVRQNARSDDVAAVDRHGQRLLHRVFSERSHNCLNTCRASLWCSSTLWRPRSLMDVSANTSLIPCVRCHGFNTSPRLSIPDRFTHRESCGQSSSRVQSADASPLPMGLLLKVLGRC
jgi:hypothetical protein